jgi:hypothetical protein
MFELTRGANAELEFNVLERCRVRLSIASLEEANDFRFAVAIDVVNRDRSGT